MTESRPRSYRLTPSNDFADPRIAAFDAALDESAARLTDLVVDLGDDQIRHAPEPANISIVQLIKHIVWAECNWVHRITAVEIPEDLAERCSGASAEELAGADAGDITSDELVTLIRDGRNRYAHIALSNLENVDRSIGAKQRPATVREVLVHLIWHWTYHTGQVGLLRDFVGAEYTWRFEENDSGGET